MVPPTTKGLGSTIPTGATKAESQKSLAISAMCKVPSTMTSVFQVLHPCWLYFGLDLLYIKCVCIILEYSKVVMVDNSLTYYVLLFRSMSSLLEVFWKHDIKPQGLNLVSSLDGGKIRVSWSRQVLDIWIASR